MREDGESLRVSFELPQHLAPFVAPKGSVALEGTSLTVNEVSGLRFGVNLIPVTLTETTWGRKKPGDEVNVEIDLFARYVARIMEFRV
jgi:riboflavin synthase